MVNGEPKNAGTLSQRAFRKSSICWSVTFPGVTNTAKSERSSAAPDARSAPSTAEPALQGRCHGQSGTQPSPPIALAPPAAILVTCTPDGLDISCHSGSATAAQSCSSSKVPGAGLAHSLAPDAHSLHVCECAPSAKPIARASPRTFSSLQVCALLRTLQTRHQRPSCMMIHGSSQQPAGRV